MSTTASIAIRDLFVFVAFGVAGNRGESRGDAPGWYGVRLRRERSRHIATSEAHDLGPTARAYTGPRHRPSASAGHF